MQSPEDQEAAEQAKRAEREMEAADHQARRTTPRLPEVGSTVNEDS